jgi:integrase
MRAAALRTALELRDDEDDLPADAYVFGNELGEPVVTIKRAWESTVLRAHDVAPSFVRREPVVDSQGRKIRRSTSALTPDCRRQLRAINLHFHDLRREAGSRWLEGGVPLHTVRDWLGHTSIAQTSTYLAGTIQGQHDAKARFDQRRATVIGPAGGAAGSPETDCNAIATRVDSDVDSALSTPVGRSADLDETSTKTTEHLH